MGIVQGGEELVTASSSNGDRETLGAGDGMFFALGIRFTPIWLARRVGFGLGGGAGAKYWDVGGQGGKASMSKYLLMASSHMLVVLDPTWLFVLHGGIEKDFDIDLSVNGTSTGVPFRSGTGFVADIGLQHALDDYWSFGFSLRVTILDYRVENIPVGANSVGPTFSLRYSVQ